MSAVAKAWLGVDDGCKQQVHYCLMDFLNYW
ncbi:hypothetical protein ACCAA_510016 [Candidatus Accumulibacter aalborgensis]|uniref:Uncharacterized protein n=1 Tax=Candidatus Accumulibacter aalborgensis TaxID=1860102 RepID=A0A1A8XS89_9PROT|nr:hypothetical protein ACCAA_510016 [Candidatus Accumulibacter aalborgensis]